MYNPSQISDAMRRKGVTEEDVLLHISTGGSLSTSPWSTCAWVEAVKQWPSICMARGVEGARNQNQPCPGKKKTVSRYLQVLLKSCVGLGSGGSTTVLDFWTGKNVSVLACEPAKSKSPVGNLWLRCSLFILWRLTTVSLQSPQFSSSFISKPEDCLANSIFPLFSQVHDQGKAAFAGSLSSSSRPSWLTACCHKACWLGKNCSDSQHDIYFLCFTAARGSMEKEPVHPGTRGAQRGSPTSQGGPSALQLCLGRQQDCDLFECQYMLWHRQGGSYTRAFPSTEISLCRGFIL